MPESRRSRSLIVVIGGAMLVTIALALGITLYHAHESELEEWREQLDGTVLLLAEQTAHEMGAADLMLDGMLERIRLLDVRDTKGLRARFGTEEEFQRLLERNRVLPQIDVASIVAADGTVVNFTRNFPVPHITLFERDYFQAHRTQPQLGLFISDPVRNKGNGAWTFYLSRRIEAPDGSFLGVVLVGVSSRQLSNFYGKIKLGGDTTVTLYHRDFTVLARWPHQDATMGKVDRNSAAFEIVDRKRSSNGTVVMASPRLQDQAVSGHILGAVRVIANYPLMIEISVPEQVYLRQWRYFALQLGAVGIVCIAAVLAACMAIWRAMHKRDMALREQRALKSAAESANRAKSVFLAMMSHEIRTPLTAVIGFAEQLDRAGRTEASELGRIIVRNGQHLLRLINDILDMSKVESGKLVLEHAPFSPQEVFDAVISMMRCTAEQRSLALTAALQGPVPAAVLGDATRWRQILLNLLSNALKFTEQGSVSATLWYDTQSESLCCRVRDTGIGMSTEQVEGLFRPFVQADSSVARRFGGTGLGLYLVQQFASAMGGAVQVASAVGAGTSMTVSIHAAPAAAELLTRSEPVPIPARHLSGRVLVVEDGADNRLLVRTLLEGMGLEVVCACDGAEGVTAALDMHPDLVLMDIHMPVLDGVSATRRLRQAGFQRPVLALTADVMVEDRAAYVAAGFDDCLAKPIERAEFERAVASHLPQVALTNQFSDLPGFAALTKVFRDGISARVTHIGKALADGDPQAAILEAHSIKGSASTFGCPDIGQCAAELENACKKGDAEAADIALKALQKACRREASGTLQGQLNGAP